MSTSIRSGRAAIGVDVGGTYIKIIAFSPAGQVLHRERRPAHRANGPEAVLDACLTAVDEAVRVVALDPAGASVGVAVPGVIDDAHGVVVEATNLGWRDVPIRAAVEGHVPGPIWVGHDVFAGSVAEFRHGAGAEATEGLFLPIGTGIAAAVLIGGRPYRKEGLAGELGHLDTGHAEPCSCGLTGCLEAIASAAAITRRYSIRSGRPASGAAEVADLARHGDATATAVWDDAVSALAFALSWATGILAPDVIVVGGGLAGAGVALLDPLRERLAARLTYQRAPRLALAQHGDWAGAVGAAVLGADASESR